MYAMQSSTLPWTVRCRYTTTGPGVFCLHLLAPSGNKRPTVNQHFASANWLCPSTTKATMRPGRTHNAVPLEAMAQIITSNWEYSFDLLWRWLWPLPALLVLPCSVRDHGGEAASGPWLSLMLQAAWTLCHEEKWAWRATSKARQIKGFYFSNTRKSSIQTWSCFQPVSQVWKSM